MSVEQQTTLLRDGSSRYYSLVLLPEQKKQAAAPLFACVDEIVGVRNISSEPVVALTKLAWWRSEIERSYQGKAQHPITRSLQTVLQQFDLPQEYFMEFIDGMEMDINRTPWPDHASLLLYAQRTTASINLLAAEIYGYQDRKTLKSIEMFGHAAQRIQLIKNLHTDLRHGRQYLPLDEQKKYDVTSSDFLQPMMTGNLKNLLTAQAQWARTTINTAMAQLPDGDRYSQLAHLIYIKLKLTLLDEIERDGFNVLQHQTRLTPVRKLWIAWRTRTQERKLAAQTSVVSHTE